MANIYTIEDELTPMPDATQTDNIDITPTTQSQLDALDAQRKADLEHINRNYNDLNQEYDDQLDIIDNMHNTIARRKVYDPRALSARQALGSLYDTIQLIGSAASMAGNSTPPAPQLTSAQAQQQAIADRLYAAQQQADQDYATQLRLITQRQQQARADIARQRRQATTEADRLRLNTNKHYDTINTRILEGERNRQHNMATTILRENNKQQSAYKRQYGKTPTDNSSELFYEGNWYKLPKNREKGFMGEVAQLSKRIGINLYYLSQLNNTRGLPLYTGAILSILNGSAKEVEITPEAYQEALDIFNTYLTPVKQTQQPTPQSTTTTKTDIPGFSASTSTTGKKTIPGF